jgi:transitional endoplasmic reticulum ATPase
MEEVYKGILPKGFSIRGNYTVLLFIKQGSNAESYRVKGSDGKLYFLKLFHNNKLHRTAFDSEYNLLEIEIVKSLDHQNIVSLKDSGELIFEGKKFGFMLLEFISGETIAERIVREPTFLQYDLKEIVSGILDGLSYLHGLPEPIIHNEITPQNVMIDLSEDISTSKIIDFGYARGFHQSSKSFSKEGLNLNYLASECFNNLYSPQSDLYSVGVLIYQMLFGLPPWFKEISKFKSDRTKAEDLILEERKKPLVFPEDSNTIMEVEESLLNVLKKALQQDPEERFQSAFEFKQALNGEIEVDHFDKIKSEEKPGRKMQVQKAEGGGFAAIAGMHDLKEQLRLDIIDALHNPEEYKKYGITIPNGMLLYGPPGCGKTFFAKNLAVEVGFNFMLITPSYLKSKWVNETQENIAKMFEEAEKNAPTIIFIDEINELLPNRLSDSHEMSKSAVNEMLAQMDRTGEKGIFIIGATNYPQLIDPAMLRAGRLDKKFYLPPPDLDARKQMFEMYLMERPLDFGISYEQLARITENFVSADIELLVNDTARIALKTKKRISMGLLEEVIGKAKPSVSLDELKKYFEAHVKMQGNKDSDSNERKIGFK